jgi:hypothetical protein
VPLSKVAPEEHIALLIPGIRATLQNKVKVVVMVMDVCVFGAGGKCQ